MNHPLKKLNQRHKLLCRLVATGKKAKQACEILGLSYTHYQNTLSTDPLVKAELEIQKELMLEKVAQEFLEDPIMSKLKAAAPKAIERIEKEIDNPEAAPKERLQASDMVLSKLGYHNKPAEIVAAQQVVINLSDDKLRAIEARERTVMPDDYTEVELEMRRDQ